MASDHQFVETYFAHPTWCTYCKDFLWGVHKKQGYRCSVCKGVAHSKCRKIAGSCLGHGSVPEPKEQHHPGTPQEKPVPKAQPVVTPATTTAEPAAPAQCFARAAFDFPPENDRELELKKGDVVEVLQQVDEWWYGVLPDGREGYFPANYVEKVGNW